MKTDSHEYATSLGLVINSLCIDIAVFGTVAEVTVSSETSDIADQEASTVTHQLIEQGTKRAKARLVNSLGFTCNPHPMRRIGRAQFVPKKIRAELLLLNEMAVFSQGKPLTITVVACIV